MSELKTTELRIRNYIKYGADTLSVKQFTEKTILLNDLRGTLINIDSEIAEPIPLTEEWLIDLGFYYSDDDNEFLELELMHKIKLYADNSNNFSTAVLRLKGNEIEIKYVHQLQNLYFALTNEQLTIK